jgi:hypothetical protein
LKDEDQMKKRLVGAIIVLALLLLFNSCASDNYIRDGYSPSGARTKEVDLVFPVTLVRGTFVFLVREFMPNGKCFIRVETLQDREWDIHSVYFFIDETRFDFVAFDKRPWTSFTKEEVAIFHASMDFFRWIFDTSKNDVFTL